MKFVLLYLFFAVAMDAAVIAYRFAPGSAAPSGGAEYYWTVGGPSGVPVYSESEVVLYDRPGATLADTPLGETAGEGNQLVFWVDGEESDYAGIVDLDSYLAKSWVLVTFTSTWDSAGASAVVITSGVGVPPWEGGGGDGEEEDTGADGTSLISMERQVTAFLAGFGAMLVLVVPMVVIHYARKAGQVGND